MSNLIVMFRKSENSSLGGEVPQNDIRVVTFLSRSNQVPLVGNGEASDLIIMSCQEVLVVRITEVTNHNAAASD